MYKSLECQDISYKPLQPLIDKFANTYRLSDNHNQRFALLLRKGIHMNMQMIGKDLMKLNYHQKKIFIVTYIWKVLKIKIIIMQKKVWNTFKIKNLGEYHDFYVQSVTLLLSDAFETFHKTGFKENKLDPIYFVSTPGLSLEACLKLSKSKIRIIN